MRISDWSSDVCSSDLALRIVGDALEVRAATDEHHLAPDRPDEMQVLQRPADLPHHRVETLPYHRDERSEEHTSELQSLMRISYAVFCLKKKKKHKQQELTHSENYKYTHIFVTTVKKN